MEEDNICVIESLPVEIWRHILSLLEPEDLWNCLRVSKLLRETANDNVLWKRHCRKEDILSEKTCSASELYETDLCKGAVRWGVWRWGGCYNWKYNKYKEKSLAGAFNFGKNCFTSYNTRLAIYSKGEHEVSLLSKTKTFSFEVPCQLKVREVHMTSNYIFVRTLNGPVVIFKIQEDNIVFYCAFSFLNGELSVFKNDLLIEENEINKDCKLKYIGVVKDQLWIRGIDKMNDYIKVFYIDLLTYDSNEMIFTANTYFILTKSNFIANSSVEETSLVNVYNLSGENVCTLNLADIDYLLASRNLILAFEFLRQWKSLIQTYDITTGKKLLNIQKHVGIRTSVLCYGSDILYGLGKTDLPEKQEAVIKALCLKSGDTLWKCPVGFNGFSARLFLDRYLVVFSDFIKNNHQVIDVNNGKVLKDISSNWGRLIYISDHFWINYYLNNYTIRIF